MSDKKAKRIFVEIDDELVNITDLDREDYEDFLEIMHKLRMVYITTVRFKNKK